MHIRAEELPPELLASSRNIATCCVQDAAADTAEAAKAAAEARLPPEPADGGSRIGEPCAASKGRHAIEGSWNPSQKSAVSTTWPHLLASTALSQDTSSCRQGHESISNQGLIPVCFPCSHSHAIGGEAQQALPQGRCSGQAVRPVHRHGESRGLQGALCFQLGSTESRACRVQLTSHCSSSVQRLANAACFSQGGACSN